MNLSSLKQQATLLLAVVCVYYHLHLIFTGLIPNLISRPIHLALALPWVFVIGTKGAGVKKAIGIVILYVCLASTVVAILHLIVIFL